MIACLFRSPAPLFAAAGMILALLPAPVSAGLAASPWAEGHSSRARLIGGDGVAAVELQMPEGWKTYWRNPGDAGGVPPSFDWSRSGNLASAQVLYPAPKRFTDRAGDTVGYKGTVVFPVRLKAKDPTKPIDLHLTLDYGVCKEICIPGEAALSLAIAPPEPGGGVPSEIGEALAHVPAPAGARRPHDPVLKDVHAELDGPKPRLVLQADFPGGADHADIFIEAPPGLYVPLPKKVADDGSGHATFEVSLDAADAKELKDQPLTATLISGKGQSEATFSVD